MTKVLASENVLPWREPFPNFVGVGACDNGTGIKLIRYEIEAHTVKITGAGNIKDISFVLKHAVLEVCEDEEHVGQGKKEDVNKAFTVQRAKGKVDIMKKAIKLQGKPGVSEDAGNLMTEDSDSDSHYITEAEILLSADNTVCRLLCLGLEGVQTVADVKDENNDYDNNVAFLFAVESNLCPRLAPQRQHVAPEDLVATFKKLHGDMHKKGDKRTVTCDVSWKSVSKINTHEETFRSKVKVALRWKASRVDLLAEMQHPSGWSPSWAPNIFVKNSIGEDSVNVESTELRKIGSTLYVEQVLTIKGFFSEPFELQSFPFDAQPLDINLRTPFDGVEFVPGKVETDETEFRFVSSDWTFRGVITTPQGMSRIKLRVHANRKSFVFIVQIVGVMTLIGGLALCTFQLHELEDLAHRMANGITLLLVAVAYCLVVNSSLPKLGYLTFMDKFVVAELFFICMVTMQFALIGGLEPDLARKWNGLCFFFDVLIFLLHLASVLITICWKVSRARQVGRPSAGGAAKRPSEASAPGDRE